MPTDGKHTIQPSFARKKREKKKQIQFDLTLLGDRITNYTSATYRQKMNERKEGKLKQSQFISPVCQMPGAPILAKIDKSFGQFLCNNVTFITMAVCIGEMNITLNSMCKELFLLFRECTKKKNQKIFIKLNLKREDDESQMKKIYLNTTLVFSALKL